MDQQRGDHALRLSPADASERCNQPHPLVPRVADRPPNRIHRECRFRTRPYQRLHLVGSSRAVQPRPAIPRREDHRHPVVQRLHCRVDLGRDDREGVERLAVGRPRPALPEPGEREELNLDRMDVRIKSHSLLPRRARYKCTQELIIPILL